MKVAGVRNGIGIDTHVEALFMFRGSFDCFARNGCSGWFESKRGAGMACFNKGFWIDCNGVCKLRHIVFTADILSAILIVLYNHIIIHKVVHYALPSPLLLSSRMCSLTTTLSTNSSSLPPPPPSYPPPLSPSFSPPS